MRNRLIHAYFVIERDIVWKTVTEEIPALLRQQDLPVPGAMRGPSRGQRGGLDIKTSIILPLPVNGSGPVGLPWPSIIAFLRLVTNPRIFEHPESIGDAWRQVHAWLAYEAAWIPQPTERHAELLY
jgi:Protein of unknown function DUF86